MNDDRIRDALDRVHLSEDRKMEIWAEIEDTARQRAAAEPQRQNIQTKVSVTDRKKNRGSRPLLPRLVAVAAAIAIVFGGINYIGNVPGPSEEPVDLNGYVYAAESRVTDLTKEEILLNTADPQTTMKYDVYAPEIWYLDDDLLVFGNGGGIVLYDRTAGSVSGLIDVQKACSAYFNCDPTRTHVLCDGQQLILYNTQDGKPFGYYHIYDLPDKSKGLPELLDWTSSGKEEGVLNDFINQGKTYESRHFSDTWDHVTYVRDDSNWESGQSLYSENTFNWIGTDGREYRSILIGDSKQKGYLLYTEDMNDKNGSSGETETLDFGIDAALRDKVLELQQLPPYQYEGDDPALGAVIAELVKGEYLDVKEGIDVVLPAPVIYGKKQKGDEVLIFGNFWTFAYSRQGNALVCGSGGEEPACYHLKKQGDNYVITDVQRAMDGEEYMDSIREMTKDYPDLYDKYMEAKDEMETVRREYIQQYVTANDLGIEYYKDYGWDPVELY